MSSGALIEAAIDAYEDAIRRTAQTAPRRLAGRPRRSSPARAPLCALPPT